MWCIVVCNGFLSRSSGLGLKKCASRTFWMLFYLPADYHSNQSRRPYFCKTYVYFFIYFERVIVGNLAFYNYKSIDTCIDPVMQDWTLRVRSKINFSFLSRMWTVFCMDIADCTLPTKVLLQILIGFNYSSV